MKRSRLFSLVPLLLCVMMLAGSVSLLIMPAAAQEISVMNGTGGTRNPVRVETTFAYRAKVNAEFTGFSFAMPTWTETNSACTLALFRWLGDPEDSLEAEPAAAM